MTTEEVLRCIAHGRWQHTDWTATLMAASDAESARQILREEALRHGREGPGALLLAHVAGSEIRGATPAAALATARQAAALVSDGPPRVAALVDLVTSAATVAVGATDAGRWRAPDPERLLAVIDVAADSTFVAVVGGSCGIWAERYEEVQPLLEAVQATCRAGGNEPGLAAAMSMLAFFQFRLCRWTAASAAAAEALEIARHCGQPPAAAFSAAVLATVEAAQGRADECRRRSLQLLQSPAGLTPLIRTFALSSIGLLELGEGRPEQAVRWLEILAGGHAAHGPMNPAVAMWQPDLVEAYIRLGRRPEAVEVLDRFERAAHASGNRRAMAAAARYQAMLTEDPDRSERLYSDALENYEGPAWAFARARTQLALAESRLRRGDPTGARPVLAAARSCFLAIGAQGWAARAAALEGDGGAPGDAGDPGAHLDDDELRVATAAALGSGADAIAAALRVAPDRVHSLLESCLAKLGLSSPAELHPLLPDLTRTGISRSLPGLDRAGPGRPGAGRPDPYEVTDPAALTVHLLGGFAVTSGGRHVDLRSGVSARAVGHVALMGKVAAEALVEEMWPGAGPGVGQGRLRSLLARVRRQCPDLLVRDGIWVRLGPAAEVDVDLFERLASEAHMAARAGEPAATDRARAALAAYGGELLPEERHRDSTAASRERLRRRYLSLLEILIDDSIASRRTDSALDLLQQAIAADPYDDQLYCRAARLLADSDRRAEALAMMGRAEAALRQLGLPLPAPARELRCSILGRRHSAAERAARKLYPPT